MTDRETTEDLYRRLGLRYSKPGWVLLEAVGNGAGFGNTGWSDAIAMQTWPSKRLQIVGFEVKASRSDWLRELNKPQKNADWQGACHEWYIVAPKDIVKLEELPTDWGLMIPSGVDRLRIASRSERPSPGTEIDIQLAAAVFRAAQNVKQKDRAEVVRTVRAEFEEQHREELNDMREQLREERDSHRDLRVALGDRFGSPETLKAKAEALSALEVAHLRRDVRSQRQRVLWAARRLAAAERGLR